MKKRDCGLQIDIVFEKSDYGGKKGGSRQQMNLLQNLETVKRRAYNVKNGKLKQQ